MPFQYKSIVVPGLSIGSQWELTFKGTSSGRTWYIKIAKWNGVEIDRAEIPALVRYAAWRKMEQAFPQMK